MPKCHAPLENPVHRFDGRPDGAIRDPLKPVTNSRTKNKLLLAKVATTSGQDASPTVVAPPGAPTFDRTRPRALKSAGAHLGQTAVRFNTDTMGYGAEVIRRRGDQEKGS